MDLTASPLAELAELDDFPDPELVVTGALLDVDTVGVALVAGIDMRQ